MGDSTKPLSTFPEIEKKLKNKQWQKLISSQITKIKVKIKNNKIITIGKWKK